MARENVGLYPVSSSSAATFNSPPPLITKSGAYKMPRSLRPTPCASRKQLVVRRSGNRLAAKLRNRLIVDDAAKCAGSENIALDKQNLIGRNNFCIIALRDVLGFHTIDIGDNELSSRPEKIVGEDRSNASQSLNRDSAAFQRIAAEYFFRRRLNAAENAPSRKGPGFPLLFACGKPTTYLVARRMFLQIFRGRTDVFGANIIAAQFFNRSPHGKHHLRRLLVFGSAMITLLPPPNPTSEMADL